MSCKYNNCKHCGYKSECEIYKENAELILGNKSLSAKLMNTIRKKLDLQKENAELKKNLSDAETAFDKMFWQKNELIQNEKDNLTKAKELLKEFVHHYKAKTIYIENMQDLLEQAEQFLSEVEK